MSGILQSLNTVAASRRSSLSPVQHRRNKLIAKIHEQLNAVKARQAGQRNSVTQVRSLKNKETGEVRELMTERPVRESWGIGNAGRVFVELRYGVKPLEFARGKNAIEVGNLDELVITLEKLKQATEEGEFDEQLMTVAGRFDKLVVSLKKSSK